MERRREVLSLSIKESYSQLLVSCGLAGTFTDGRGFSRVDWEGRIEESESLSPTLSSLVPIFC